MRMGSFNREDWVDMEKEYIILNLKSALDKIDKFEKTEDLLEKTEKWRLKYLNENLNLKKKLGEFVIVKKLMDSAGIYGYTDFIKDPLDEIFVDKHYAKKGDSV